MFRLFHLVLLATTIVLGVVGISRLSYNVEILDLLPKNMAGVEGTRILKDTYEKAHQLILTVDAPTAELAGESMESLEAALKANGKLVRRVITKPSWESDPTQLGSLGAYGWLNAPPEKFNDLVRSLAPEQLRPALEAKLADLAISVDNEALALGAYDPLGLMSAAKAGVDPAMLRSGSTSEFSSEDGTFRVLYVDPAAIPGSYRETHDWLQAVRNDIVKSWQTAHPEFSAAKISFTGSPSFRSEISMGMEEDMNQSIGGITLIVGFLFWLLHRTIKPLVLLMLSLLASMLLTLGIAGLLYGSLNVMSMGFAAILMGMIEDFGVIGLHEWLRHPKSTFWQIHRRVFPGVFWSAITSSLVFASLAFSGMPGIVQLGILTGVGILVGAVVMLYGFLPLAMKFSRGSHDAPRPAALNRPQAAWRAHLPALTAVMLFIFCATIFAWRGLPGVYREANVLHPTRCESMESMLRLQGKMQPPELLGEWLPILVHAKHEQELCARLASARDTLKSAQIAGQVETFYFPEPLCPNADHQTKNFARLAELVGMKSQVMQVATEVGFTDDGLAIAREIFATWDRWIMEKSPLPRWPDRALLEGTLGKILNFSSENLTASGFLRLPVGGEPTESAIVKKLETLPGLYPGGWRYLNDSLKPMLNLEVRRVCLPAAIVLFVLLVLVFRNVREIVLVLGSIAFSGMILLAAMSALRIDWNFVNVGAVPLMLGLGLDFNIHMVYSLRRQYESEESDANSIGRALAYCGLSTGLGFGALAMSGNRGLITFGQCAMIGVLATLFTAAFLLPWVWQKWKPTRQTTI